MHASSRQKYTPTFLQQYINIIKSPHICIEKDKIRRKINFVKKLEVLTVFRGGGDILRKKAPPLQRHLFALKT
jgi:hypothetical protein